MQSHFNVSIIGSGNWGSTIAKVIGENVILQEDFNNKVKMYVWEEIINGENLTSIINKTHENVKYLPGIKLPVNIEASSDLLEVCEEANILVFVLPCQYILPICEKIKNKTWKNTIAINLCKGIGFDEKNLKMYTYSEKIREILGIDCSSLCGANIANEVAQNKFGECTLGYSNKTYSYVLLDLFKSSYLHITLKADVVGVELCGALKSVIALSAGFCDGANVGMNTKCAIIRLGLGEMIKFSKKFYPEINEETFMESCGIGDLIAACFGGATQTC